MNNCSAMQAADGANYKPFHHTGASTICPPVVSSESMCVGHLFTVILVGTVGPTSALDSSAGVRHAALVMVHPANGSGLRCEVFTGEQMNPLVGQVQFQRSGLPPMHITTVRHPCPVCVRLCWRCMPPLSSFDCVGCGYETANSVKWSCKNLDMWS